MCGHGAADARWRAQAQGNALRPVRRYSFRTLSAVGCAEALAGRGTAEGRFRRPRVVHGDRLQNIENPFAEMLANLPNRFVAVILKFLIQPFGAKVTGPSDRVVHQCAQLVLEPSAGRDRLTADLSHVDDDGGVARLEKAFLLVVAAEDVSKQMRAARLHDWKEAGKKGVITQAGGEKLQAAHEAVAKEIEVEDFGPGA